jgi:hypothetical protein
MSDLVQIANVALDSVGQGYITSLDDNTPAAKKAKKHIFDAIREVLEAGLWKQAQQPVILAQLSTAPLFGYAYAYQLPNDYLRMVSLNEVDPCNVQPPIMEIRGNQLHTDESDANVIYIRDLGAPTNDINLAGAQLTELFSLKLAVKLAWAFQQSKALKADLNQEFIGKLRMAKAKDAQEGKQPIVNQLFESNWVKDRQRSTNG